MPIIHAYIVFCMVLWPKTCSTVEVVPIDHGITSVAECIKGPGMTPSIEFSYAGSRWRTKGIRCEEEPSEVQAWLNDRGR